MSYSEKLLDAIENQDFSQNKILLKQALDNDEPEVLASLAENLTSYGFTNLSKEVYRSLIAKFPKEDLKIIMEEAGTYHLPVLGYLLDKGYQVIAENALKNTSIED